MHRKIRISLFVLAVLLGAGCIRKTPLHVQPPQPPAPSPIEGIWESSGRSARTMQMVFAPDGQLTFQGGLEFYNPGRWDWDPIRKKLKITLPQASDEKLQIFKLSVGDGVQAFDRQAKEITYYFDDQTSSLNVAGWTYFKKTKNDVHIGEEPVLR